MDFVKLKEASDAAASRDELLEHTMDQLQDSEKIDRVRTVIGQHISDLQQEELALWDKADAQAGAADQNGLDQTAQSLQQNIGSQVSLIRELLRDFLGSGE